VRSLPLGRVNGIEIRLHPTLLLVVLWVLVDWERIAGDFGSPAWFGLVVVALAFGCVLLHELGHAAMALQQGIRVHDVTLSVIGGVARMGHASVSPRTEAAIALAGPAVNLAIVVLLLPALALAMLVAGGPESLLRHALSPNPAGLLITLLVVNLMLLAFNLLPAFPMDGGRLLRAALASWVGRDRATAIAVRGGQALALLLGIYAVVALRSPSLALVAAFVIVAAQLEMRAVRVESALRRMRVGQFALWDMGGVAPGQPLSFALRGGARDMAVTERGKVVGMLWRNRLLNELGSGAAGRAVSEVMETGIRPLDVDTSIFDAHQRMKAEHRFALPVTEDGVYRGIFTSDRLVHVHRQVAPPPLPGFGPNDSVGSMLNGLLRLGPRPR